MNYLRELEAESIYILREAAAQFKRPALLFSGGKDSTVMARLAEKAFRPGRFPFPLLHIDTGHNFDEVLEFRDWFVDQLGERLVVGSVEETLAQKGITAEHPDFHNRNRLQSTTLMDAIRKHQFDACIGGARRDEEKARAKERIFSLRGSSGAWDPNHQRPELWNTLNGRLQHSEHMRVFPISNWSELDIWRYIEAESLTLPSIYFAHNRNVIRREGKLVPLHPYLNVGSEEFIEELSVRFRTVGDMTCTAAVSSTAQNAASVIEELQTSTISERGETRIDDSFSESAMEERKAEGYF
ncbi:MAG TPA: sulfate adenylyltransferase subunit CysD [Candidatus Kapabacteria bacterium]|nr:sulfate adenylyltransferase subunit CysD [Candidatus Kapabacteria bacterium]